MAKKNKKNINRLVVYESNFDFRKYVKLMTIIIVTAIVTVLLMLLVSKLLVSKNVKKIEKKEPRKLEYTNDSNIYYFDPAYLIKDINNENLNYILIDTRSFEEYDQGHIKSSVNIPLYTDYKNIEKTKIKLNDFVKKVLKNNLKRKPVVLYGYYSRSQILLDGALYLSNSGIKIQVLAVSWYEFKNNPFMWLPGNDLGVTEINKYLEGKMYEN